MENLILVDENDNEIGVMEKLEAHRKGILHRAFSIFVFNSHGQLLIQKRARAKYHSSQLWADTCSGHQRPGEDTQSAAERRLREEMGISPKLEYLYKFFYKADLDNGFKENECDHVLVGRYDGEPSVNKDEVEEYAWRDPYVILADMEKNPHIYAYWFKISLDDVLSKMPNTHF